MSIIGTIKTVSGSHLMKLNDSGRVAFIPVHDNKEQIDQSIVFYQINPKSMGDHYY